MTDYCEVVSPISERRSERLFKQKVLGNHLASDYFAKYSSILRIGLKRLTTAQLQ